MTHLFAVALIISDYTDDEDTIVAALLHDTLEDTDYSARELEEDFGGTVRDIVISITEPPRKSNDRRDVGEQKKQYLKNIKNAPEKALMVLAADKIHNMRSIVEEYFDNHSGFMADFGAYPEDRLLMYQEISNTLNRTLKNDILAEFNSVFAEYKKFLHEVEKTRSEY